MKRNKLEEQDGEVFEEAMYVNGILVSEPDPEEEEDDDAPDTEVKH